MTADKRRTQRNFEEAADVIFIFVSAFVNASERTPPFGPPRKMLTRPGSRWFVAKLAKKKRELESSRC
jgi:hypothetical protein